MNRTVRLFDDVSDIDSVVAPYLDAGEPFTGLSVEIALDGRIAAVSEVRNGFDHGYAFDLHSDTQPCWVEHHVHGARYGLSAEWEAMGKLLRAERLEFGHATQRLDPETGRVIDITSFDNRIATARRLRPRPPAPLTKTVRELLDTFEIAWPKLLEEAQVGWFGAERA